MYFKTIKMLTPKLEEEMKKPVLWKKEYLFTDKVLEVYQVSLKSHVMWYSKHVPNCGD